MCGRCGGLMYKPWDDLGLRCFICSPASFSRPATECQRCGGLMYTDADNDSKCWNCGRSPITRHATEQDSKERKHDTMRGGAARELRRLTESAS